MFEIITGVAGLLGLSVSQLSKLYKDYRNRYQDSKSATLLKARHFAGEKIANDGLLKQATMLYYDARGFKETGMSEYIIATDGHTLHSAMAVLPEWIGLINPLDNTHEIASFIPVHPPKVEFAQEQVLHLLHTIELMNLRLWGGPIYRLLNVDLSSRLTKSSFAEVDFLHYRFTVGLVVDELVDALSKYDFSVDKVLANANSLLPVRNRVLPDGQSLLNFRERICAGGITMVFAMPRPKPYNDFIFPIQQRSASVADGQGMLSIIPRGFHESLTDQQKDVAPSISCYREVYEELFGGKEVEKHTERLRHDWFFGERQMRWFIDHKESYELICTCFGVDMVSGNYQFGTVLIIHDEEYWDTFGREMEANWEGKERTTRIISTKDSAAVEKLIKQGNWTGEGLQTLCEGLFYLKKKYPRRLSLPNIKRIVPNS